MATRKPVLRSGPRVRGEPLREFCDREGIDRTTAWRWVRKGILSVSRVAPRHGVRVRYSDQTADDEG
jgi:predicted site-specific integrase-resolvase